MAELVDALDSGSSRGNSVDVRVILAALYHVRSLKLGSFHAAQACLYFSRTVLHAQIFS